MEEAIQPISFPESLNGFTFIEYLTMFSGLVFAFAAAEYFIAIGSIIRSGARIKLHWEYVLWTIIIFFLFIVIWYLSWLRLEYITNNLWTFFLLNLPSFLFFLIIAILFPDFRKEDHVDTKIYLENNIRKVFFLLLIYLIVNLVIYIVYPTQGLILALITQSIYIFLVTVYLLKPVIWLRRFILFLFFVQVIVVFNHI